MTLFFVIRSVCLDELCAFCELLKTCLGIFVLLADISDVAVLVSVSIVLSVITTHDHARSV